MSGRVGRRIAICETTLCVKLLSFSAHTIQTLWTWLLQTDCQNQAAFCDLFLHCNSTAIHHGKSDDFDGGFKQRATCFSCSSPEYGQRIHMDTNGCAYSLLRATGPDFHLAFISERGVSPSAIFISAFRPFLFFSQHLREMVSTFPITFSIMKHRQITRIFMQLEINLPSVMMDNKHVQTICGTVVSSIHFFLSWKECPRLPFIRLFDSAHF